MDSFVISFSGKENIPSWECFQPQSLAYLKTEGGLWSINCSFVHWWEHVDFSGVLAVRGSCLVQKHKDCMYSTYTSICSDGTLTLAWQAVAPKVLLRVVTRLSQSSESSTEAYFEVIRSLSTHKHCKWNVLSHSHLSIFQTDCGPLAKNSLLK